MKNSLGGFSSRLDATKERISELNSGQSNESKLNKKEKTEEKPYWRNQNIWDNIKQSNMQVTGV